MSKEDYGPTISDDEYIERMTELHETKMPVYDDANYEYIQKAELSITIDHRLGICFPYDRRDDLWNAQNNIQKKKIRLFFLLLLTILGFDRLGRVVYEEFSKVLSPDEMMQFFGHEFYNANKQWHYKLF